MDYYKELTDDQLDTIIAHRQAIVKMLAFHVVEQWLTEKYGSTHKITVDFRIEFVVTSRQDEQYAQKKAQEAYNILTKMAIVEK